MTQVINVVFVKIKSKQVIGSETVSVYPADKHDIITRRLESIQYEGAEKAKAIFGEGATWDFSFPMNLAELDKKASKLFRSL